MSNSIIDCFNRFDYESSLEFINQDNINIPFLDGKTVLYKSILLGLPAEFIEKIILKGADVNYVPKDHYKMEIDTFTFANPLKAALSLGQIETVKLLLEHGAKIEEPLTVDTVYEYILKLNTEENSLLDTFFAHGLTPDLTDKSGKNLLHYAVLSQNPYSVKKILELKQLDVNKEDLAQNSPISLLLKSDKISNQENFIAILNLLLENNAILKQELVFDFIKKVDEEHLFLDLEDPKKCQRTAILTEIVSKFDTVDITDADGRTLLSWAAYKKEPDNIRFLLKSGANPDIADRFGHSPKVYMEKLFPETMCLLDNHDADLSECYSVLKKEDDIFELYMNSDKKGLESYLKTADYDINNHNRLFSGRLLDFMTHYVLSDNSEFFYKTLVQNGANPELRRINFDYRRNKYGNKAPITVLADNFNPDTDLGTMYYMVKYAKNRNVTDSQNNTLPMFLLIKGQHLEDDKMKEILDAYIKNFKFDFDITNNENKTFFDLLEQYRPELIFNYQHLIAESSLSMK